VKFSLKSCPQNPLSDFYYSSSACPSNFELSIKNNSTKINLLPFMKNLMKVSALLMVFLITLASCEEKEKDPTPATKTELLTAHTWKVTKVTANGTDYTQHQGMKRYATSEVLYKTGGTYHWATLKEAMMGIGNLAITKALFGKTKELKWREDGM
jgi:hypothetical protein